MYSITSLHKHRAALFIRPSQNATACFNALHAKWPLSGVKEMSNDPRATTTGRQDQT